ncbi:MAG: type II toxin-antitoxin system HicA family toxin [Fibrobacterota bacterium]|nr:type II toxin-antitoxin system HicA family toxin [Fibrobacterota bacterium]
MTRLPRLSGEEIIKALERMGFEQVRQKGSHVILKKVTPEGAVGCVVPMHKEVALGTLRSVLRQAHLTPEEFEIYV